MKLKKGFLLITFIILILNVTFASNIYVFDMPMGWSRDAVESALESELLTLEKGYVRAGEFLTRAEMAQGISNIFRIAEEADISEYKDVSSTQWYYEYMAKAVEMNLFSGYGNGLLKPDKNITREEMLMAFYNILELEAGNLSYIQDFNDKNLISSWSEHVIARMVEEKFVVGNLKGNIKPIEPVTREEFAQVVKNIFKANYKESGTYTEVPEGTVIVSAPNVKIKGETVNGDIIVTEGINKGKIILEDVIVNGKIIVRGNASVEIINNSKVNGEVVINDTSLMEVKKSNVNKVTVNSQASETKIIGNGELKEVIANANNVTVEIENAQVTAGKNTKGVKAGIENVAANTTKVVSKTKVSSNKSSSNKSSSNKTECSHEWKEINVTCEEDGYLICMKCNKVDGTKEKLGHNWETINPTCSTDGYIVCMRCNKVEIKEKKLGHNWLETVATCETDVIATCQRCNKIEIISEKLGHSWIETVATCEVDGYATCERCSKVEARSEMLGHSWIETVATCEVDGYVICERCNKVEERVGKLGHIWVETVATCEAAGYATCKRCNKVEPRVGKLGHSWVETVATCEADGYATCERCNTVEPRGEKLGHSWVDTVATCETDGYATCERCNKVEPRGEKLGHSWIVTDVTCETDGYATCERCGKTEYRSEVGHSWQKLESLPSDSNSKRCGSCNKTIYYVTDFGAIGDGIIDDTVAINNVIANASPGDTVYFPDGNYFVNTVNKYAAICIEGKENLTIHMSNDAIIKHGPTESARYYAIYVWKGNGIKIIGGNIVGESDTHTYEYAENGTVVNTHGYGIRLSDSEDILVQDVKVSKFYGDGIIMASDSNPKDGCKDVILKNCTIFDSLRNGITVTSCQGLQVVGCEIYNIMGAYPMAGIDIECEYEDKTNSNIVIEESNIYDCLYSIELVSKADDVTIKNCNLENTLHTAITTTNVKVLDSNIFGMNANVNGLEVSNCNLGSVGLNNSAANCTFKDCDFSPNSESKNALCIATGANGATGNFINCIFNAPTVQNVTFYTIWCNATGNLEFKNCRIDTNNRVGGKGVHGNIGNATFDGCTFINENQNVSGNFLQIDANNVSITNSLFDASIITAYGDNKLIRIYSPNINVQNCELKTANNNTYKPATYAFACNASSVTGDVKFVNNTISGVWDESNFMLEPTTANSLVVKENVFK